MDSIAMIKELRTERKRIDALLSIFTGSDETTEATPTKRARAVVKGRRTMSAATRRKISTTMKATWGRRVKGRKLSPAVKKRISTAMKKRWAEHKKAAVAVSETKQMVA